MSTSNRMYDRLCKLYNLVLVRMRKMEAARAFSRPRLRVSAAAALDPYQTHRLEPLEPRVLLSSSAPVLPGMHLSNNDIASWQGQIVYLDFDGASDVTYDGPAQVGPFDVPAYQAPTALAGQENAIEAQVLSAVQATFADTGVRFTIVQPEDGTAYSTVYVGGDDSAFRAQGRFTGLAEEVDTGNQNPADNAIVFSDGLSSTTQLTQVVEHEIGHLLGYAHDTAGAADTASVGQQLLSNVADNMFTFQMDPAYVNQNQGQLTLTLSRTDISTTQTLYATTLQDQGDVNDGYYDDLDHQAVTFEQGESTAQVSVTINDLGLTNGSETFRLILQESAVDPLSPVLATTNFTIVNNATNDFSTSSILGLDTNDTGIVDHLTELYSSGYRFVGLHLGQDSSHLSAADAAQIEAAGMKVFSIYQQAGMTDTDANGDHSYAWQDYFNVSQGETDAAAAYFAATQYAQQPFGTAIYFSIDLNPADTDGISEQSALYRINAYFLGIQNYFSTLPADSSYTVGVMGAGATLTHVTDSGFAEYTWLAASQDWPGYSDWNVTPNLPASSNVVQGSSIAPQAQYGNISFNSDKNWAMPLGAWHEDTSPQINVLTVALTLPIADPGEAGGSTSLTVAAMYLVDGDTITITPPAGVEVSTNSRVDFSNSLTLTPVNGYLKTTKVYIRTSAAATTDVSGDVIITSALDSSLSKTVHVTGKVLATPDTTPPTVDVVEVSATAVALGNPVNIYYTVSDAGGAGLSTAWVFRAPDVDGAPGSYQTLRYQAVTGDEPYSSVFTDTPGEGTWWYKVEARDKSGNYSVAGEGATAPIAVTVQDMTPTVTGLSPDSGSTLGGTEVVITGTDFTGASAVYFGDTQAASFTVDSDTQITAITPANEVAGAVDVTVTTPQGTTDVASASEFTYSVFTANLTPDLPAGWASKMVLSHQLGTHTDDSEIYNDQDVYLDWSVVNTGELATGAFTADLYVSGSYLMTLGTVSSLSGGESISFEDVNIGKLSNGPQTLQLVIDSNNAVAESNETDNTYTRYVYVNRAPDTSVPTVDAFSVPQTAVTPGTPITISYTVSDTGGSGVKQIVIMKRPDVEGAPGGLNFIKVLAVTTDGPYSNTFTDTQTSPGKWWYSLEVIDGDGNTSQGSDFGFDPIAVTVQSLSTITDLSPASGLIEGGQSVVITGTDFTNASAVHFGDLEAGSFTIDSDTQITVITPAALATGVVDVTVTTPVGTSAVIAAAGYTYLLEPANLTADQPAGWSDSLVVSNATGTHTDGSPLLDSDNLYLDWSITNVGQTDTAGSFTNSLYVDSILQTQWQTDTAVVVNGSVSIEDYELGQLTAGTHTLQLVIDSNNDIAESDETDNTYTRTITVDPAPNQPPAVVVQTPVVIVQDDVTIHYTLSDAESDTSSVLAEYSTDSGVAWHAATQGQGGDGITDLTTSIAGVAHTFVWDSQADMPDTQSIHVRFRLTPSDGSDQGVSASTDDFVINHLPVLSDLTTSLDQDSTLNLDEAYFTAGYNDPDVGPLMTHVRFISLPEHGTIKFAGTPIANGAAFSTSSLSDLTYTPDAGYTGTDSFSWNAKDGIFYSLTAAQVNLTINPVAINLNFDFGTAVSPLLAGATKVTHATQYSAGQGYGWQSGLVDSRDRGALPGSDAQTRDLNFTSNAVFAADVDNGFYIVTVQLGDVENYLHDNMGVYLENTFQESVNTAKGQVVSKTYTVTVTDGQLNLRLKDLGGVDANVTIQGLQITNSTPANQLPVVTDIVKGISQDTTLTLGTSDFTSAFTDTDAGDSLQLVKIVSLPGHGVLELNATAVAVDQEIAIGDLFNLRYIPANGYTGTDSFSWNGSDGNDYAENAAAFNLTIAAPGNFLFDFGTADSSLLSGATRVSELSTYSAGVGYGWKSGNNQSRDRGATSGTNALSQDLIFTKDSTFAVNLANGFYNVTVYLGDTADYIHDYMGVYLENTQVDSVSTGFGEVVARTYGVTVADGQLTLRLKDLGGVDANVTIQGLQITSGVPVNHPPAQTDINKSLPQNTTLQFTAGDFTSAFSDPDPSDSLQLVTFWELPTQGTLKLNGVDVTTSQEILVSQLNALAYTPNSNFAGSDSIGWKGSDGSLYPTDSFPRINLTVFAPVSNVAFDFGTVSSPLEADRIRVTDASTYSAAQGFGWQSGEIFSRDRGTLPNADALTRDLNFTTDGTFAVDLANGNYQIVLKLGDAIYAHDNMGIYFENNLFDTVSNARDQVVTRTYTVVVTDGQLNLRLKDLGGIDPYVCIEGLKITSL